MNNSSASTVQAGSTAPRAQGDTGGFGGTLHRECRRSVGSRAAALTEGTCLQARPYDHD